MTDAQECGLCDCFPCVCGQVRRETVITRKIRKVVRVGEMTIVVQPRSRITIEVPYTHVVSVSLE